MYENHKIPVVVLSNHSTYKRVRVIFDKFLHSWDLELFNRIVNQWYKDCRSGAFGEEKIVFSFENLIKFSKPVYVIRFDIALTEPSVIDKLITYIEEQVLPGLRFSKLERIEIATEDLKD